ncbi:MAG: hypothetical protein WBB29_10935 [Geitlerinemataceae cyanobacterium]
MNNLVTLAPELCDNYRKSLKILCRAISLSSGEFSLILAHCNNPSQRQELVKELRDRSSVPVRAMVLPNTTQTIYTSIYDRLNGQQPSALTILGLESVRSLDEALISANFVRNEFRKQFPFPLIIWVTDTVLRKMMRLAPDLESWAMLPIDFT